MTIVATKKRFQPQRHKFWFKVENGEEFSVSARVERAKKKVILLLTPKHVMKAIAARGQGNSQKCAGAMCILEHKDAFDHPVVGFTDFNDGTCHMASKLKNGMPIECVLYYHSSDVPKMFDTISGLKKLLEMTKEKPVPVILRPPPVVASLAGKPEKQRPRGNTTGVTKKFMPRGAHRRYARVELGAL